MPKVRVYYQGLSDVREISKKHLRDAHGIDVSADLVWTNAKPAINIDINDELLAILKGEGTFKIVAIEDDGTLGEEIVEATISDDTLTSSKIVDASTGQESVNPDAEKNLAAAGKGKTKDKGDK